MRETLELPFIPPLDWPRLLRFFGGRATAGVETVSDGAYTRTVMFDGCSGQLSVWPDPARPVLIAQVEGPASQHMALIKPRLERMFDLHADPERIRQAFSHDPWLAGLVSAAPGLRVPGAWSGFELVVRTIVGQQVSVKAATTIVSRLVERAGTPAHPPHHPGTPWQYPSPAGLAAANLERIGMPGKRVAALQHFAHTVASGGLEMDGQHFDLPALRKALLALPGIGPWTVEYVAMRAWRDADAWPGTDLVLMQAISKRHPALAKHLQQLRHSEGWRPWRAYAAMHVWNEIADAAGQAKGG